MSNLELRRLDGSTREQGYDFQSVMSADLLRIGVPEDEAVIMGTDGGNADPGQLLRRMEQGSKEYYGLYGPGAIIGAACVGTWLYGDEAPFVSSIHTGLQRARHKLTQQMNGAPSHDSGLFAFGIAAPPSAYDGIADELLEDMRAVAAKRQSPLLKAAVDTWDDELIELFERKGARQLHRKIGSITIHSVKRQYLLYGLETK